MSTAGIVAIVVSHDSEETLDECVSRLRGADGVVEIRVVDNDSRDGSMDVVQRHALADARVRFVANPGEDWRFFPKPDASPVDFSGRWALTYRDADGKVRFCHTLNNTVAASTRLLIALLENHQAADGTVRVPKPLKQYLGGRERIGKPLGTR